MASDDASGTQLPDREQLLQAIETAQAAHKAQSTANDLKSKAQAMTDPKQREKMLQEAFDKEIEANGHSKAAKRMQSGTWQGLGFGGGIGAATGLGLGAGLGTVLGAVTAVPTAGLGMLVGSGVGAIHGPWIKLGGKEQKLEDANPNEVVDAIEQEKDGQQNKEFEQQLAATAQDTTPSGGGTAESKPRRKPKKLEIRSQRNTESGWQPGAATENAPSKNSGSSEQKAKRKPKKLEVRSGKNGTGKP
ncbi:hypothetical protein PMZ80_000667 [Knufia obscura]|uniref:Uncharacterized protein n=2 Tax=Knufia TaxID=430999 RepID=A0AAN8ED21_9EURO|nr:hypothetical protein PMZ80_000667 [Knufia obscura]KAK5948548.1 hypothetical protein OHC33_010444 [Knufia fluminis]